MYNLFPKQSFINSILDFPSSRNCSRFTQWLLLFVLNYAKVSSSIRAPNVLHKNDNLTPNPKAKMYVETPETVRKYRRRCKLINAFSLMWACLLMLRTVLAA